MFYTIIIKTIVVHTLTYFLVGLLASKLFNYNAVIADPSMNMRPMTHPLVRAGVLFQPLRGFLFGTVFYLLSNVLFSQNNGWLIMWFMLITIGIFSTFAPAPSSIEGLIYNKIRKKRSFLGLIEVLVQSFLLSIIIYYWVNHPEYGWLSWTLYVLFFIVMVLPILGLLAGKARP